MPALLISMSSDSTWSAAAWICAVLVTSRLRGVTRSSGWASGWRVPAYTRLAPLARASAASACPMPRLAPVTRTVLSLMVMPVVRRGVTVCSGQECQLADGGPGFQFGECLRPVGQVVRGGLGGAEHAGGEEPEHLAHELAEDLRRGLDQHADVQADEVDLVPVDEVPVV